MGQQSDRVDRRVWIIAAACSCGPLMSGVDSTMVNVSLDTLSSAFHVPLGTIQWVTTGYLLALALSLPLSGWLVDRVGARRIFLGSYSASASKYPVVTHWIVPSGTWN